MDGIIGLFVLSDVHVLWTFQGTCPRETSLWCSCGVRRQNKTKIMHIMRLSEYLLSGVKWGRRLASLPLCLNQWLRRSCSRMCGISNNQGIFCMSLMASCSKCTWLSPGDERLCSGIILGSPPHLFHNWCSFSIFEQYCAQERNIVCRGECGVLIITDTRKSKQHSEMWLVFTLNCFIHTFASATLSHACAWPALLILLDVYLFEPFCLHTILLLLIMKEEK